MMGATRVASAPTITQIVLLLAYTCYASAVSPGLGSPTAPDAPLWRDSAGQGRIAPILSAPAFVAAPVTSGFGLRSPLKAQRVLRAARHINRQTPTMMGEGQDDTFTSSSIWSNMKPGDAIKGGVGALLGATLAFGLIFAPAAAPVSAATTEAPVAKTAAQRLEGADLAQRITEKADMLKEILVDIYAGYVDPVDIDKLSETAFNAMLNSLDPFTEFENARASKEMRVAVGGKYAGVGMTVAKIPTIGTRDPALRVVNSQQGYAFDKGVRVGDTLMKINGKEVATLDTQAVNDMLDGKPGTSIKIQLMRDGWSMPKDFTLTREEVVLPEVPLAMMLNQEKRVGYVALSGFSQFSAGEVAGALTELQRDGPLSSLILDLRGNPGGLLGSAVDVANLFVPKGTPIVSTKGRTMMPQVPTSTTDKANFATREFDQTYFAEYNPLVPRSTRIVVLVNGETASAAEIVSGALQDHDRAVVVGERTFGKGLVQQIQRLSQPGTQIKLTIAKYYTPSGRCIQSKKYKEAGNGRYGTVEERMSEENRKAFRTDGGRVVRSAGGIEPDLVVKSRLKGMLERDLLEKNAFFQWAGEWEKYHALEGEQMSSQGNIALVTDDMYEGFIRFVKDNFPIATGPFDPALDKLKEALQELGYAEANPDVDLLKEHMAKLTEQEFYKHKEVLKRHLQAALNERFLPAAYKYASSLQGDEQLKAAIDLANSIDQYSAIVRPAGNSAVSPSLSVSVDPEEYQE